MKNIIVTLLAVILVLNVNGQDFGKKLAEAAIERTNHLVIYNGKYVKLDYPNGDVHNNTGVCTDVVIRSYRGSHGIDLQKYVHEDMKKNFSEYPQLWNMKGPDSNIDHRRTQNLECFFTRMGAKLPITDDPKDYQPGDIVFWGDIGFGHVGVVSYRKTIFGDVPLVIHNIGWGVRHEDFLFDSRITGHYRWNPKSEWNSKSRSL